MKLASNESIKKEWDSVENEKLNIKGKLTVTNKRVIYTIENQTRVAQKEVGIDKITSIETYHQRAEIKRLGLLTAGGLCLGFGVFGVAASFAAESSTMLAIGLLVLICGLVMTIVGSVTTVSGFCLSIKTLNSIPAITIGQKGVELSSLYVQIEEEDAKDIIDTLGALLCEAKDGI